MRVFIILFLAAYASAEIDWANIRPVTEMEGFWEGRDPRLVRTVKTIDSERNSRIVNGEVAHPHQFPYQAKTIK